MEIKLRLPLEPARVTAQCVTVVCNPRLMDVRVTPYGGLVLDHLPLFLSEATNRKNQYKHYGVLPTTLNSCFSHFYFYWLRILLMGVTLKNPPIFLELRLLSTTRR